MKPPRDGSKPSRRNLATRILNHLRGNAYESTLRLTLGCLLAKELGIRIQRIGSGDRLTFGPGERILSGWMAENAFVTWALRVHGHGWLRRA